MAQLPPARTTRLIGPGCPRCWSSADPAVCRPSDPVGRPRDWHHLKLRCDNRAWPSNHECCSIPSSSRPTPRSHAASWCVAPESPTTPPSPPPSRTGRASPTHRSTSCCRRMPPRRRDHRSSEPPIAGVPRVARLPGIRRHRLRRRARLAQLRRTGRAPGSVLAGAPRHGRRGRDTRRRVRPRSSSRRLVRDRALC